jgi:hypothetical protein
MPTPQKYATDDERLAAKRASQNAAYRRRHPKTRRNSCSICESLEHNARTCKACSECGRAGKFLTNRGRLCQRCLEMTAEAPE